MYLLFLLVCIAQEFIAWSVQQTTVSELNPYITEQFVFCCIRSYQSDDLAAKSARALTFENSVFFHRCSFPFLQNSLSFNEKYKKLCTQVHFSIVLLYFNWVQITSCLFLNLFSTTCSLQNAGGRDKNLALPIYRIYISNSWDFPLSLIQAN